MKTAFDLAESKGFCRCFRIYRLALLVATSAKTVHRTVFFRMSSTFSLLVRIPLLKKQKQPLKSDCFVLAESKGFEPSNTFRALHDFQSCSFGQLGQLSISTLLLDYTLLKYKLQVLFLYVIII